MFLDQFTSIEDVKQQYCITDDELQNVEIICAIYETGCYEGSSIVLFKKDCKLYIIEAGHRSCIGLEHQWSPVETNEDALKMECIAKKKYNYDAWMQMINFCEGYFGWNLDE